MIPDSNFLHLPSRLLFSFDLYHNHLLHLRLQYDEIFQNRKKLMQVISIDTGTSGG